MEKNSSGIFWSWDLQIFMKIQHCLVINWKRIVGSIFTTKGTFLTLWLSRHWCQPRGRSGMNITTHLKSLTIQKFELLQLGYWRGCLITHFVVFFNFKSLSAPSICYGILEEMFLLIPKLYYIEHVDLSTVHPLLWWIRFAGKPLGKWGGFNLEEVVLPLTLWSKLLHIIRQAKWLQYSNKVASIIYQCSHTTILNIYQ